MNIDIQSAEFIQCLERGEQDAFQRVFEMYHKPLCFFATRIVRDDSEAEDIVQEVFLSLWKMNRSGFPNLKTVKTFLYNSVQHRCLNYLRDLEIRDRNYKNLHREELDEDYFLARRKRSRSGRKWLPSFSVRLTSCRRNARIFFDVRTWTDRKIRRLPRNWIFL